VRADAATSEVAVTPKGVTAPDSHAPPPYLQTSPTRVRALPSPCSVKGPAVYIPEANEWVHTFSWHGSVTNGKGSQTGRPGDEKQPHALTFQKLRCMPDQMYFTVRDVRTSDDAQIQIHLMIFFEVRRDAARAARQLGRVTHPSAAAPL